MSPRAMVALAAALGAVALAGCGEKPQTSTLVNGKYQGKADTTPWSNSPLGYDGGKWTAGDKASWNDELKNRTLHQNEYVRIGG